MFEWHEARNSTNFKKHGVWFEKAQTIRADPGSLDFHDPEHSSDEDRFIRIGYSSAGRILLVVFCEKGRGGVIRIIGARKPPRRSVNNMKNSYDLKKLRKREGTVKADPAAAKSAISIRLDGSVLAAFKTEALRMGIPYQTLIGSVLHRYVNGELMDRQAVVAVRDFKSA